MLGDKNLKQIIAECSPEVTDDELPGFMDACNNTCDILLTANDWDELLYPSTIPVLNKLQAAGHTLGIFTGTREDAMTAQLYMHRLQDYFDLRLIEGKDNERDSMLDSTALKKRQISRICQTYASLYGDAGPVMIIGDSTADYNAAKALNLPFIAIARGEKEKYNLKNQGVQNFIEDMTGIFAHLETARPVPDKGFAPSL